MLPTDRASAPTMTAEEISALRAHCFPAHGMKLDHLLAEREELLAQLAALRKVAEAAEEIAADRLNAARAYGSGKWRVELTDDEVALVDALRAAGYLADRND